MCVSTAILAFAMHCAVAWLSCPFAWDCVSPDRVEHCGPPGPLGLTYWHVPAASRPARDACARVIDDAGSTRCMSTCGHMALRSAGWHCYFLYSAVPLFWLLASNLPSGSQAWTIAPGDAARSTRKSRWCGFFLFFSCMLGHGAPVRAWLRPVNELPRSALVHAR